MLKETYKKDIIFFVSVCIVLMFLVSFIVYNNDYIRDCMFGILALGLFYLIEKKYPIKPIYVILVIIPIIINLIGLSFNFFSFSILGIGYDKILHFINTALITLVLYFWISKYSKNMAPKLFLVILIVLGLGAVGEIMEFVGQKYVHIYGPSMFSQGDLLPTSLKNDLVIYDTWWDMIFDLFGASFMAILIATNIIKIK